MMRYVFFFFGLCVAALVVGKLSSMFVRMVGRMVDRMSRELDTEITDDRSGRKDGTEVFGAVSDMVVDSCVEGGRTLRVRADNASRELVTVFPDGSVTVGLKRVQPVTDLFLFVADRASIAVYCPDGGELDMLSITASDAGEIDVAGDLRVLELNVVAFDSSDCDLSGVTVSARGGLSVSDAANVRIGDGGDSLLTGTVSDAASLSVSTGGDGVRVSTEDAGTVRANGKPSPSRHVTADLLSIAERKRMRTAVKRMAGERGEDVSIAAAAPVRHDPGARVSDVLSGSMQVAELVDWLEGQCDRVSMEKAGRAILIRCFKSTLEKNWPGRVKAEAERRFPEACSVALVTPEVKMSVGGGR